MPRSTRSPGSGIQQATAASRGTSDRQPPSRTSGRILPACPGTRRRPHRNTTRGGHLREGDSPMAASIQSPYLPSLLGTRVARESSTMALSPSCDALDRFPSDTHDDACDQDECDHQQPKQEYTDSSQNKLHGGL